MFGYACINNMSQAVVMSVPYLVFLVIGLGMVLFVLPPIWRRYARQGLGESP